MLLTYLFYPFLKPYQVTSVPKPNQTATISNDISKTILEKDSRLLSFISRSSITIALG